MMLFVIMLHVALHKIIYQIIINNKMHVKIENLLKNE